MTKNTSHSNYWLDSDLFDDENELQDGVEETEEIANLARVARLSAARRATANFVNILTGRNDIPVRYSSGKDSYTDGKEVIIAADDNPNHFDSMVGLALHEGSHVLLSDFEFVSAVAEVAKQIDTDWGIDTRWGNRVLPQQNHGYDEQIEVSTVLKKILHPSLAALLPPAMTNARHSDNVTLYARVARQYVHDLQMIMNILEDRRIDKYVYQNCGGYRPYYDSLYERYFFTTEIERNLRWNPSWRELTVENYINRLLFVIHPASNPTALPGLDTLIKMMDLRNIERIAPTDKVWKDIISYDHMPAIWQTANELYAYILRFVARSMEDANKGNEGVPTYNNQPMDGFPSAQSVIDSTNNLPNLDIPRGQMVPTEVEEADKTKAGKEKPRNFNDKRGKSQVEKAKDVVNGELKKRKAKKAELLAADALENAQAKMVDLKGDGIPGGECMVTRKMSEAMFTQDWFIFRSWSSWDGSRENDLRKKAIAAGKRMGQIMVHRLQVRNDPVMTKNTRLQHGGLDRRLLAQLGMDITSVFQKSRIDTFKPAMLHLTLDASGSMSGRKWEKVLTVATALAYVGNKMRNIDTVITIRGGNDIPVVCVVFDSRKDQFTSWLKWAPRLSPAGSTPEGLCFKATMELITECASTHDVYFINFSDGEPGFSLDLRSMLKKKRGRRTYWGDDATVCSYQGEMAFKHTRQMVQNMKDHGIKVLSYFITESSYGMTRSMDVFRRMYGEDAVAVNVENASDVIRTLNKALTNRGV